MNTRFFGRYFLEVAILHKFELISFFVVLGFGLWSVIFPGECIRSVIQKRYFRYLSVCGLYSRAVKLMVFSVWWVIQHMTSFLKGSFGFRGVSSEL